MAERDAPVEATVHFTGRSLSRPVKHVDRVAESFVPVFEPEPQRHELIREAVGKLDFMDLAGVDAAAALVAPHHSRGRSSAGRGEEPHTSENADAGPVAKRSRLAYAVVAPEKLSQLSSGSKALSLNSGSSGLVGDVRERATGRSAASKLTAGELFTEMYSSLVNANQRVNVVANILKSSSIVHPNNFLRFEELIERRGGDSSDVSSLAHSASSSASSELAQTQKVDRSRVALFERQQLFQKQALVLESKSMRLRSVLAAQSVFLDDLLTLRRQWKVCYRPVEQSKARAEKEAFAPLRTSDEPCYVECLPAVWSSLEALWGRFSAGGVVHLPLRRLPLHQRADGHLVPSPAFLSSAVFQPCELCVEIKERERGVRDTPPDPSAIAACVLFTTQNVLVVSRHDGSSERFNLSSVLQQPRMDTYAGSPPEHIDNDTANSPLHQVNKHVKICVEDIRARLLLAMVQDQLFELQRQRSAFRQVQHARIAHAMELHFSKAMRKQNRKNSHAQSDASLRQSISPLGMVSEDDPGFIGDVDCTIGQTNVRIMLPEGAFSLEVRLVPLSVTKRTCMASKPSAKPLSIEGSLCTHLCSTYAWQLQDRLASIGARSRATRNTIAAVGLRASDTLAPLLHLQRVHRVLADVKRSITTAVLPADVRNVFEWDFSSIGGPLYSRLIQRVSVGSRSHNTIDKDFVLATVHGRAVRLDGRADYPGTAHFGAAALGTSALVAAVVANMATAIGGQIVNALYLEPAAEDSTTASTSNSSCVVAALLPLQDRLSTRLRLCVLPHLSDRATMCENSSAEANYSPEPMSFKIVVQCGMPESAISFVGAPEVDEVMYSGLESTTAAVRACVTKRLPTALWPSL